ncbi:MAG: M66 family metalloprotease, partial [Phycisphaeraceae bacterium]|nr:M66 family metalloprotease [Phycisphaeraceae bacterium]
MVLAAFPSDRDAVDASEKPARWDEAIDFTANLPVESNLKGTLQGQVAFLQNTLVHPRRGKKEVPLLVTDRGAYLLFVPSNPNQTAIEVTVRAKGGRTLKLKLNRPEHGARSDFDNSNGRPRVVYSKRAWNGVVPWDFMHPGVSMTVTNDSGQKGTLAADGFEFGPPLELVTQNIELAMLVDQDNVPDNLWAHPTQSLAPELAIDYYQHLPIARFTVGQYLPITFGKVVLPDGTIYTDRSTFQGAGIHKGDMRQAIAKCMVSTGINLANVGRTATPGGSEKQPRPFRITTVHTSAGRYTKKGKDGKPQEQVVVHGLSGGGGQLTLLNTTGNEYSHEYGHDHGLGHYPGKERGLDRHHRNGAWGYHLFKHRLIANVDWNRGKGTDKFPYEFGRDAMASGRPMGPLSVFTLHTPYALKLIQAKITAQSGVLDAASPTGYKKWDAEKQALVESFVGLPRPDRIGAAVVTLVGFYDPQHKLTTYIYPALYGNWGNVFKPETIRKQDPKLGASKHVLEVADA